MVIFDIMHILGGGSETDPEKSILSKIACTLDFLKNVNISAKNHRIQGVKKNFFFNICTQKDINTQICNSELKI